METIRIGSPLSLSSQLPSGAFQPAAHPGGCGRDGRLRLLSFHGRHRNSLCLEKELQRLFPWKPESAAAAELEFLDAPHVVPEGLAPDFLAYGKLHGGCARSWHRGAKHPSFEEQWPGLTESLDAAVAHIQDTGPYDGLCGCGQGASIVGLVAMLAEEGATSLQGQFKFVICIGGAWPNSQGPRPQASLRVPACHIQSSMGALDGHCIGDQEHFALHWQPGSREIVTHALGPELPELEGDGAQALASFLGAFLKDELWSPRRSWNDGVVLPVAARPSPLPTAPPPQRRLLAVCFPDVVVGESRHSAFQALRSVVAARPELHRRLAVDCIELERHVCLEALQRPEGSEHRLSAINVKAAERVVESALKHNFNEAPVLLVGVGVGAYIALRYACALRELGGFPAQLVVVSPPAVFPVVEPGSLGPCNMLCLVASRDEQGERWRFEMATEGHYQVAVFAEDKGEDAWTESVLGRLRSTVPSLAAPAW